MLLTPVNFHLLRIHFVRQRPHTASFVAYIKIGRAELIRVTVGPEIHERRFSVNDSSHVVMIPFAVRRDLSFSFPCGSFIRTFPDNDFSSRPVGLRAGIGWCNQAPRFSIEKQTAHVVVVVRFGDFFVYPSAILPEQYMPFTKSVLRTGLMSIAYHIQAGRISF